MFISRIILAATLIINTSIPSGEAEKTVYLLHLTGEIQELCKSWEINEADNFPGIEVIRNNYVELQFAPKLADLQRFPNREIAREMMAIGRKHIMHLEERRSIDVFNADHIDTIIFDTQRRILAWDELHTALAADWFVSHRRRSLASLRDKIGYEAYYSGNMPAPVPLESLHWFSGR